MKEFSRSADGFRNEMGDPMELVVSTNYGRVFIDHINLNYPKDRDYKETLELSVPEALAVYAMLKEFVEEQI